MYLADRMESRFAFTRIGSIFTRDIWSLIYDFVVKQNIQHAFADGRADTKKEN